MIVYDHEMTSGIYLIKFSVPYRLPVYYVGQATNFSHRFSKHRRDLRLNQHHNSRLQRLFNKYGEECLSVEVLEHCDWNDLDSFEQFWLDFMVGANRCANVAKYAEASGRGLKRSPETRKRIADAKTGLRHSEETKKLISKIQLGRRRKPHTHEARMAIGAAQIGKLNHSYGKTGALHHRSKPVQGVHVVTGEVVKFESSHSARSSGFVQSGISRSCNSVNITYKGYLWSFVTPVSA